MPRMLVDAGATRCPHREKEPQIWMDRAHICPRRVSINYGAILHIPRSNVHVQYMGHGIGGESKPPHVVAGSLILFLWENPPTPIPQRANSTDPIPI